MKKRWPGLIYDNHCHSDLYFTYTLSDHDKKKFLNIWFEGAYTSNIYREMITLKEVDEETANNLYREKYNPVLIFIKKYIDGYQMKAQICSIDDSSYGIWWPIEQHIESYELTVMQLMKFIDEQKILNGHYFINYCINKLNADFNSIDYN